MAGDDVPRMAWGKVSVGLGWAVVLVALGSSGCGHALDAFGCQLGNHGDQLFGGLSYDDCMRHAADERANLARLDQDEATCRDGVAPACYRAALANDRPYHRYRAQEQYETACQANIGGGCLGAGVLMLEWGTPDETAGAMVRLRRACDLGVARGCSRAAGVKPAPVDHAGLDERACVMGEIVSCARAGDAQVGVDRARARKFYEQGCRGNDPAACAGIGRLDVGAR